MGQETPFRSLYETKEKKMKSENAEKIKHLQTRMDALKLEIDQALASKQELEQRLDVMVRQKDQAQQ